MTEDNSEKAIDILKQVLAEREGLLGRDHFSTCKVSEKLASICCDVNMTIIQQENAAKDRYAFAAELAELELELNRSNYRFAPTRWMRLAVALYQKGDVESAADAVQSPGY